MTILARKFDKIFLLKKSSVKFDVFLRLNGSFIFLQNEVLKNESVKFSYFQGIDYCPGQRLVNITSTQPMNHTDHPILYNIEADPGEKYPIYPNHPSYQSIIKIVSKFVH